MASRVIILGLVVLAGVYLATVSGRNVKTEEVLKVKPESELKRTIVAGHKKLNDVQPVNLTLYFETLCPGCNDFVLEQLIPTWNKLKADGIMTADIRPYGNAHESQGENGTWVFECQHGAAECDGNVVETCIIHYYPETDTHLTIINCFQNAFFTSQGADWKASLSSCESTGVDVDKISSCASGPEGNALEHEMALLTGDHEYTPWVLINGVQDEEAHSELLQEVCKAYKGEQPDACKEIE